MHELSLAEEIRDLVLEKLKEHGKTKVTRIVLVLGEMTSIVPEALQTALTSLSSGTPLENARISQSVKKTIARCRSCGKKFRVSDLICLCPSCASGDTEIVQGRELLVKTISME